MPLLTPSGPGNTGPVDVAIALALGVTVSWLGFTRSDIAVPYALPIGVMVVAGMVAALIGPAPLTGTLAIIQDIMLLAWAAAIVNVARDGDSLKTLLRVWSWSAIFWAGAYAMVGIRAGNAPDRLGFTFANPNMAANYFLISLFVMAAAGIPRGRLSRYGGYGVVLLAIVVSGSLAGIVGLGVALIVSCFLAVANRSGFVPAIAFACIALLFAGILLTLPGRDQLVERASVSPSPLLRNSIGRLQLSEVNRSSLYSEEIQLFEQGGVLGLGPNTTDLELAANQASYVKTSHNDYLAVVVERGVAGAIGLLLLVGAIWIRTRTSARRDLSQGFRRVLPLPEALAGAVAAVAVSALFHEVLHFRQVWALLAVIAAIDLWGRAARPAPESAS